MADNSTMTHEEERFHGGKDTTLPANHPINALSPLRKFLALSALAFCGLMGNFSVAILMVAFVPMGAAFDVSPGDIPNTIGYQLLGVAVSSLIWCPLSKTIGRRPVYIIGSLLPIPICVWLAESNSFGVFSAARFVMGLFSGWSQTIPPSTIADMYLPQERGRRISLYAIAVVISPAVAPVFCGLIVDKHSWRILFWFILALSGLQLAIVFFLIPETLWNWDEQTATPQIEQDAEHKLSHEGKEAPTHLDTNSAVSVRTGRVGAAWMPWQRPGEFARVFISPILMLRFVTITIPSIYYGSLFAWSVGITIVAPQKFEAAPYGFETIPLGCSFLAYGIGGVLGKWSGGIVGDKVVGYFERKKGSREPEDRLWALLPILPFFLAACLIFGICIDKQLHWIAPLIGGGLFFFCLSAATGVLQTYVLECYLPRSMDTQAVFTFWKMIWGFAVPFFVYDWGTRVGFTQSYAVQGALATGVGFILCLGLIWKGRAIRMAQGMPEFRK